MENLEGYVEKIIYRNTENGYTVLTLSADGEEVTCVGSFVFVNEGEYLVMTGDTTAHSLYGEQFKVSTYEQRQPTDRAAMERYLAAGAIKGIGEALAARIVSRFGEDTFRIIEEEPERLAEVKGISRGKAQEIYKQFYDKKETRNAILFLQKYGVSMNLSVKIFHQYGEQLYEIISVNPYRLAEDIAGVGFRIADEIASRAGISRDSEYRIRAGLLYCLQQSTGNGHCYLPEQELLLRAEELLLSNREQIMLQLEEEISAKKLMIREINGERCVYTTGMYYMELNTARMLLDLNRSCTIDRTVLKQRLQRVQEASDIQLEEEQQRAIEAAAGNGLFILTGGPGTGKTTTINAIIHFFEAEGMEILLAAPTGRAAKRMTETTGTEARTIHRLLENTRNPDSASEEMRFERNEMNPLETDVVIIDEMSMVDIQLMYALLKAVPVGTRLILVGDENQLPSVGPGNVLHDIIAAGCFPLVRLSKIFRQAGESDIVVNAHKINAGEDIALDNKSRDFFMLQRSEVKEILGLVVALVRDKLPKYVHCGPMDIQVLTAMRKGELGVERLNQVLQYYLNPASDNKKEREAHGVVFREGDKVMQIKNDYQLEWEVRNRFGVTEQTGTGVFNGDVGIIKEINSFSERVTVEFDEGRLAEYTYTALEELEPAYAVTVHKSQGSEYPAVVIPVLTGPRQLMHRNILYTAVTRAKSCVTLVGSKETVHAMIQNSEEQKRYTGLTERIREMAE